MLIYFVDEAVILVPSEHALPLAAIKISKLRCLLYFLTFHIPIFKSSAFGGKGSQVHLARWGREE